MSLPKAILIFALSAVVCTIGGAAMGFCLGRFAPAYYYNVVPPRPGLPYEPVAVGVGLGLTQGLVAGLCVGGVIVLALAIATWRRNNPAADAPFARRA